MGWLHMKIQSNDDREFGRHCAEIRRRVGDRPVKLVVDVGASIGGTVRRYLSEFEHAQIIAFEPVQGTFTELASNVGGCNRVCQMNLALGASQGVVELYHQPDHAMNSISPTINTEHPDCGGSEMVTVTTLDRIVKDNNIQHIDVLKLDTEHFELEIIQGADQTLGERRVSFIYAEVTFDREDQQHTLFSELKQCLDQYDFQHLGFFEHFRTASERGLVFCNALFAQLHCLNSRSI